MKRQRRRPRRDLRVMGLWLPLDFRRRHSNSFLAADDGSDSEAVDDRESDDDRKRDEYDSHDGDDHIEKPTVMIWIYISVQI